MAERQHYLMVQLKRTSGLSPYITLTEVASRCGVHPELIDRFVFLGLVDPVGRDVDNEFVFSRDAIPLVRKIIRLRNHLGVNYAGIGVILELMSRIEALEAQIREMERSIFADR